MNRFFRSALFPLVVIVLLVYLASQTLITKHDGSAKYTFSQLIQSASAGNVESAVFNPNRQEVKATLTDGKKVKVHWPTDQAQFQLQQILETKNPGALSK